MALACAIAFKQLSEEHKKFGVLIDEADAFVRKRGKDMSEDSRNALNAFLFRTGTIYIYIYSPKTKRPAWRPNEAEGRGEQPVEN